MTSLTDLLHAVTEQKKQTPASAVNTGFAATFIAETIAILQQLDLAEIERMATALAHVREAGGRLFILGVGGSAGHAGHAVNDFRKLCGFEAYAPTDNVSELTARANDEGWETCFAGWLAGSRINSRDAVLVFSVGGGSREKNVSVNIVRALETADAAGRTSSASWAAMVASRAKWPKPAWWFRPWPRSESRRIPKVFARWFGIFW